MEEGLADGGSADAELGGEVAVAEARAGQEVAAMDAIEDLAADLVAKRGTGDHRIAVSWFEMQFEYNI
jgi:hypothetical protein